MTIIAFDDLLRDTPGVMTLLSARLGIDYDEGLTRPTFNLRPISSNSSYSSSADVSLAPLERWKTMLSDDDRRAIDTACGELYESVRKLVERPEGGRSLLGLRRSRRSAS